MVMAWLELLVWPGLPTLSVSDSAAHSTVSGSPWLWTLHFVLTPRLAMVLSRARWAYVAIFILLLLQFCTRFWKLRVFLRASQPPPDALLVLFESVRSGTRVPRCELRLVPDLRSPAANGWWCPKILLPHDLLPRLKTQQLVDILRHELMHVRRRDYLWDTLATLGCCLVFFHPAVWLARRRLRWERELVCDEDVVEHSGARRLEYATCLTTLAGWWWLPEREHAGPVDFLSSPSLLATRVRALVSTRGEQYSVRKKIVLGLSATAALAVAVWILPEVAVTSAWSVTQDEARMQEAPLRPQPMLKTELLKAGRSRMPRHHKPSVDAAIAPDEYRRLMPVKQVPHSSSLSSSSVLPSTYKVQSNGSSAEVQTNGSSARHSMPWGLMRKVGTLTVHSVKFGIAKLGFIGGGQHDDRSKIARND
jgi:beta-lactamase regulating signal transducer with metallopeptidase domain